MIINQPSYQNFETVSVKSLTQSFNLIFDVYLEIINAQDNEILGEEASEEDIWKHHEGTISTSLILLYQAIEGLLKSTICRVSPLLLIDKPRKEWPVFPLNDDKDFDSLYTISGEHLLATFCAVNTNIHVDQKFITFIDNIREKRNKAMHGIGSNVTSKFVIENILETFTTWFGVDAWHKKLKQNIIDNPIFGFMDGEFEESIAYKHLDFALFIVGKKVLNKHVSVNLSGRNYFCPICKKNIDGDFGELKSKWAFLNPNQPDSNNIRCINCHQDMEVKRMKCIEKLCKGNVIFDDADDRGDHVCLTCFKDQDYNYDL